MDFITLARDRLVWCPVGGRHSGDESYAKYDYASGTSVEAVIGMCIARKMRHPVHDIPEIRPKRFLVLIGATNRPASLRLAHDDTRRSRLPSSTVQQFRLVVLCTRRLACPLPLHTISTNRQ